MAGKYRAHFRFRNVSEGLDCIERRMLEVYQDAKEKLEFDKTGECELSKDQYWVYDWHKDLGEEILQAIEDIRDLM